VAGHTRGLDERGAETAGREAGVVGEVPVLHAALDRLVLAHRRQHRAIAQGDAAQRERREELRRAHASAASGIAALPTYSAATRWGLARVPTASILSTSSSSSRMIGTSFFSRASPSLPSSLKVVSGGRTSPTG